MIVLTREAGCGFAFDPCRSDSTDLVGGDRHSDPASANQDAQLSLPIGYLTGQGLGKIWIIDRVLATGSDIENLMMPAGPAPITVHA